MFSLQAEKCYGDDGSTSPATPATVVPLTREDVPSGNVAVYTDVPLAERKVTVSSSAGPGLLTAKHNTKPRQKQLEIATAARNDVMSRSAPMMSGHVIPTPMMNGHVIPTPMMSGHVIPTPMMSGYVIPTPMMSGHVIPTPIKRNILYVLFQGYDKNKTYTCVAGFTISFRNPSTALLDPPKHDYKNHKSFLDNMGIVQQKLEEEKLCK